MGQNKIIKKIKLAAGKKILFLSHAIQQMCRVDRMITIKDVRDVIEKGEIIEDYPEDSRGHSCLMFVKDNKGRPIHFVCSPKEDYLAIITAYIPDPNEWTTDYKVRVKK